MNDETDPVARPILTQEECDKMELNMEKATADVATRGTAAEAVLIQNFLALNISVPSAVLKRDAVYAPIVKPRPWAMSAVSGAGVTTNIVEGNVKFATDELCG